METKDIQDEKLKKYKKSSLEEYIDYYAELKEPGYAVLVTGDWGVGKTTQVKRYLDGRYDHHYVSLYGVESVSEIHKQVFLARFHKKFRNQNNILDGKNIRKGFWGRLADYARSVFNTENLYDKVATFLAGLFDKISDKNGIFAALLVEFVSFGGKFVFEAGFKNDFIIVFDDLERSSLWNESSRELLGAINYYVEHQNFRVIVICNDKEDNPKDFFEQKEKVFGRTIKIFPDNDSAFIGFVSKISGLGKGFIIENEFLIQLVWNSSGKSSLRIFRYALNDLSRLRCVFFNELLEEENKKLLEDVLVYFFVMFIEFYSGDLKDKDLVLGSGVINGFVRKYKLFKDLSFVFIENGFMESVLSEGVYDKEKFRLCFNKLPQFSRENDPAWRRLVRFDELDDEKVDESVREVKRILNEGSVNNIGEFLHMAAMLLLIESKLGVSLEERDARLSKVRDDCTGYIKKIFFRDGFNVIYEENSPYIKISYEGYAYWVDSCTESYFSKVRDEAFLFQNSVKKKLLQEKINRNIGEMKHSPDEWFMRLVDDKRSDVPLELIPADIFVGAWLKVRDRGYWLDVCSVVSYIFKNKVKSNDVDVDNWILEVFECLDSEARRVSSECNNLGLEAKGLASYRIDRLKQALKEGLGLNFHEN